MYNVAFFFQIDRSLTGHNLISCPLDYLLNPKNPTPPKLRFVSPPEERGGGWGWGAMTAGIITNYADTISLEKREQIVESQRQE